MGEAIAARSACPWSSCCLLAQHPALDGFLQRFDACLHSQLGHLPQKLRAHPAPQGAHCIAQLWYTTHRSVLGMIGPRTCVHSSITSIMLATCFLLLGCYVLPTTDASFLLVLH